MIIQEKPKKHLWKKEREHRRCLLFGVGMILLCFMSLNCSKVSIEVMGAVR